MQRLLAILFSQGIKEGVNHINNEVMTSIFNIQTIKCHER